MTAAQPLALGYVRVSTVEQAEHGASLEAQRAALTVEAERRGWELEIVTDQGLSAKNLNRPALTAALERLDRGQAQFLLAVRLDRLSRSVADFAGLLDRAGRKGWGLVLQSPNIDTSDPAGRFTANVLASAAQYERELIGARTREGMAQRKLEGAVFGRPRAMSLEALKRIMAGQRRGDSLRTIAAGLEAAGIPTAHGGARWHASTIKAALESAAARESRITTLFYEPD